MRVTVPEAVFARTEVSGCSSCVCQYSIKWLAVFSFQHCVICPSQLFFTFQKKDYIINMDYIPNGQETFHRVQRYISGNIESNDGQLATGLLLGQQQVEQNPSQLPQPPASSSAMAHAVSQQQPSISQRSTSARLSQLAAPQQNFHEVRQIEQRLRATHGRERQFLQQQKQTIEQNAIRQLKIWLTEQEPEAADGREHQFLQQQKQTIEQNATRQPIQQSMQQPQAIWQQQSTNMPPHGMNTSLSGEQAAPPAHWLQEQPQSWAESIIDLLP